MKKTLYIFLIFLLYSLSFGSSYAFSWDSLEEVNSELESANEINTSSWILNPEEKIKTSTGSNDWPKTIREIKENIDELKEKTDSLEKQWKTFEEENWSLASFFKKELLNEEKLNLQDILNDYKLKETEIEQEISNTEDLELVKNLKTKLLFEKKELYKSLVPYVESSKLKDYLDYVKSNIKTVEISKIVKAEIDEKEQKLQERVIIIKEKKEKNDKELSERIKAIVKEKLNSKIYPILENEKFKELSVENQKKVFQVTLAKLEEKKKKLENSEEEISQIEKKVEIYNIAIEVIEKTIENIK